MNNGIFGIPKPPHKNLRIQPPSWKNYKTFTTTTSNEVVPQDVYQMLFMVWGAGGNAYSPSSTSGPLKGGGGGGFAMGILDVVPGQILPTITVATSAGSSSSVGSLLSATGGQNATSSAEGAGGTGTVSPTLRGAKTATGGYGSSSTAGLDAWSSQGGSAGFWTGNGDVGGYLGGARPIIAGYGSKAAPTTSSATGAAIAGNNGRSIQRSLIDLLLNPISDEEGGDLYLLHAMTQVAIAGNGGIFSKGGYLFATAESLTSYAKAGAGGFGAPGGDAYGSGSASGIPVSGNGGFGCPCGKVRSSAVTSPQLGTSGIASGGSSTGFSVSAPGNGFVIAIWTEGY